MKRRDFLLSGCARLLVCATLPPLLAQALPAETHRGGRVGWARLKTPSEHWSRHTGSDGTLSDFIRTHTTLNMEPEWRAADPERLEELGAFPFLFCTDLAPIVSPKSLANLSEYLRRGGFLLVDACCNREINPDDDLFLANNTAVFRRLLPEMSIKVLPQDHPIYTCYFTPKARPPHTHYRNILDPKRERHGLYGIYLGDRLASLLSLSGLQCGWDHMVAPPGHPEECMKMVVNIYVTAMTA
jgi:hypothetical protein